MNMKKLTRILSLLLLICLTATCFSACNKDENGEGGIDEKDFTASPTEEVTNYVMMGISYTDKDGKETSGKLVMELYPDIAPITVQNFKDLVADEFYDGLTFHRVYKGFMIQGGDPKGNGTGDSGTRIKGEFTANGVQNDLSHTRGVVSMARGGYSYDSASCQFFIMHKDSDFLDGQYAAFGRVIYGMDTVDGIANTAVKYNSGGEKTSPISPVTINYAKFVTVTDSTAE